MKNKLFLSVCAFAAIFMCGCGEKSIESSYFGKQERYSDFLFCKYEPDTIEQTLIFDTGEETFTKPLVLGLYKIESITNEKTGEVEEVECAVGDEIKLFANGKECQGTSFNVYPGEKEITLGVVFSKDAEAKDYYWNLKVIDAGDLDMINEELTSISIPVIISWKAGLDTKMNPLAKVIIWICIILIILLTLWFILFRRIIFPTFVFDNLQVVYFEGETRKNREDISLRGVRKVICDKNAPAQGKLNLIFCGRVENLTNSFWEHQVILLPCGSNGIAVSENITQGTPTNYRMAALITPQNGPRKPFIVKKNKSEHTASVSIG